MEKKYHILLDEKHIGMKTGLATISEEGALVIYAVYIKLHGNTQSMDRREERGGICWLSEINGWIDAGHLPKDFDWKKYEII